MTLTNFTRGIVAATAICFSVSSWSQSATNMASTSKIIYPSYPSVNYGTGSNAEKIKRGEYLTKLGDCIACHTEPHGGKPFAGGYPIETPFGTIYSPNLTSDKKTGLGDWSEADFIHAMREGISAKGHYYFPAFPYLYFNSVTTTDLQDIWAYLKSVPAVEAQNKKSEMIFPLNWRFLQLGWRILFFETQKTGPYKVDATKSALWNRGNYLVNGLAHCGMCHTPSYHVLSEKYSLAAPMRKYLFTGNLVQGYYAPNITNSLLKNTTVEEFSQVFLKNRMIGGGMVQGPMREANENSLKYLSMDDIKAIYTYLNSIKNEPPAKPAASSSGAAGPGKDTYEKYCTGCHTTGAGGAPKFGDVTDWEPRLKQGMNALYKNAINGIGGMPPKGTCITCTDKDIEEAVDYLTNASKGSGQPGQTSARVKAIPKLTIEDGKRIYEKHCDVCHAPNVNYLNSPKINDTKAWEKISAQGVDVVIMHTINGYGNMPARGGCTTCNDAEIKAAVKYMLQTSQPGKDYHLW